MNDKKNKPDITIEELKKYLKQKPKTLIQEIIEILLKITLGSMLFIIIFGSLLWLTLIIIQGILGIL